ncbi:hypothetical protein [Streptomyces sp. NPDC050546]|uniref:hypothetical protein n=1 Tax=Streptomyces sp. NPDC050546 TaxID=3365628 RepID=UPI0037A473BA
MRRQNRFEGRGADRVAAPGDPERELEGEFPDDGRTGALPLGPDETQVIAGAAV